MPQGAEGSLTTSASLHDRIWPVLQNPVQLFFYYGEKIILLVSLKF
ncbi:hypothetical protein pah_c050o146 [Parachlamydia acanthamoebae str. Hall's coccus]|nr:hypothetical protein pah_c050o146 [Parachlamydia acanthamoebae str. Hall's coccus]